VEGWRPVEDIVRWGFGQAPVVMANEFRQQAANLGRLLESAPGEPMLVWCGNSHASKHGPSGCDDDEWIPMGWNFRELTGPLPAKSGPAETPRAEDGA
jgi:hypothetical protein